MVLVNANGMVQVNLGLASRQVIGRSPALDYQLTISSIPAMTLPCDLSDPEEAPSGPCFISLYIQFPTFDRQASTLQEALSWVVSLI